MVNGTHTPVIRYRSRNELYPDYFSFKLKRPALNTQIGILMDGTFCFVSHSAGAGCSEGSNITQIKNSDYSTLIDDRNITMMDGVYQGVPWPVCKPYRNPRQIRGQPRVEMSRHRREWNTWQQTLRGLIERRIGAVKGTFQITSLPFRHPKKFFSSILRFCCALMNLEKQSQYEDPAAFDPESIIWVEMGELENISSSDSEGLSDYERERVFAETDEENEDENEENYGEGGHEVNEEEEYGENYEEGEHEVNEEEGEHEENYEVGTYGENYDDVLDAILDQGNEANQNEEEEEGDDDEVPLVDNRRSRRKATETHQDEPQKTRPRIESVTSTTESRPRRSRRLSQAARESDAICYRQNHMT
jgi:hypothetical protein